MKSEKGVTLAALVVYMLVMTIIIALMTTISTFFFDNVNSIKNSPKHISEFNKFAMFFIQDVKKNSSATVASTQVTFSDGTVYRYSDGKIYRNNTVITKKVKNIQFASSTYKVGDVTKNIIKTNITLGDNNQQIQRNIDFVLKYW